MSNEAQLGLATTEEMFRELITRFTLAYPHNLLSQIKMNSRALQLSEMLGGLSEPEKEYRTVDGG